MGAHDFLAEIDTSGPTGPRLSVDGSDVPLAGYGYVETPDGVARWHFDVVLDGASRAGIAEVLARVDPKWLEGEALARVDAFDGQASPVMSAALAVLREVLRAGP